MEIIDCFTYNGERDILNLRLNILDKYVDRFIIVEAKTTFTGKKKPLYFSDHERYFSKWWKKITYHIIDENYSPEEIALAYSSPNTQGAEHWKHEFLQKESIKKALEGLRDNDMVFVGDVDEIWNPELRWQNFTGSPFKLKLKVYAYYLDNLSNEEFYGPLSSKYLWIKNECLNHLRTNAWKTNFYAGWHFTSMGGVSEVRRKLNDSYTEESYNTSDVQELLEKRVTQGVDYLGRPFIFKKSQKDWPTYLKQNKSRYQRLILD